MAKIKLNIILIFGKKNIQSNELIEEKKISKKAKFK